MKLERELRENVPLLQGRVVEATWVAGGSQGVWVEHRLGREPTGAMLLDVSRTDRLFVAQPSLVSDDEPGKLFCFQRAFSLAAAVDAWARWWVF